MNWNLKGKKVVGKYLEDIPFEGTVTESEVSFGGVVWHTVVLDSEIVVFGETRDEVTVPHEEIGLVR